MFFSPGFDDKVTESLDDGLKVQDAMTAVGQALRAVLPAARRPGTWWETSSPAAPP